MGFFASKPMLPAVKIFPSVTCLSKESLCQWVMKSSAVPGTHNELTFCLWFLHKEEATALFREHERQHIHHDAALIMVFIVPLMIVGASCMFTS